MKGELNGMNYSGRFALLVVLILIEFLGFLLLLPAVIQDVPFSFLAFVATFFALFVFYSAFSLGFLRWHIDSDN